MQLKSKEDHFNNMADLMKVLDKRTEAFSVIIDDISNAQKLINQAKKLGLTVERGVMDPVEGSSSLAFFFENEKDVDVNFISTSLENIVRNLIPRYSAKDEFFGALIAIREGANRKNALRKDLDINKRSKLPFRKLVAMKILQEKVEKLNILSSIGDAIRNAGARPSLSAFLEEKQVGMPSCLAPNYIEVQDHFVQVGTEILSKDPNDTIIFNGVAIS